MKKTFLFSIVMSVSIFLLTSCEKDDIGGTKVESMAGEWYVTAVAVDEEDNLVYTDDDLFALGYFHLDTYNLSSNDGKKMWIDDNANFYFHFKNQVDIDLSTLNFSCNEVENAYDENTITISNGKILNAAATTPSGSPADSIVFNVNFDNDAYPEKYGYASYRIAGYRYTGLTNDD